VPPYYCSVLDKLWVSRKKDRELEDAEQDDAGKATEPDAEQQKATDARAAEKVAEPEEGTSDVTSCMYWLHVLSMYVFVQREKKERKERSTKFD